jgi:5-methylcytosine-specific restriction endonuclease McrA
MKNKKPNAEQLWKQLEDLLVPRLRLSVIDRAVYSHLLRHSRLEGKLRLRFSIARIGQGARLGGMATRRAVRRLVAQGVLRVMERGRSGHLIEVRLPEEICAARGPARLRRPRAINLEETDFLQGKALRQAIHAREGGRCFYCLRLLTIRTQSLDHVVPRVELGRNSYRNLVSCCMECNAKKGQSPAEDLLRWLYRERRLTPLELEQRLRALDALASGKLPPALASTNLFPRKGRPPLHPANP